MGREHKGTVVGNGAHFSNLPCSPSPKFSHFCSQLFISAEEKRCCRRTELSSYIWDKTPWELLFLKKKKAERLIKALMQKSWACIKGHIWKENVLYQTVSGSTEARERTFFSFFWFCLFIESIFCRDDFRNCTPYLRTGKGKKKLPFAGFINSVSLSHYINTVSVCGPNFCNTLIIPLNG